MTNQKETKRAIKAAVDQANKVRTHCAVCGCTPKPDEWYNDRLCIDCGSSETDQSGDPEDDS